jgi:MerR family copper efflux transcriptional regulator
MALRMDVKGSCADVRRRIGAKIISLNRMRSALERLIESCSGDAPSSECPVLEAIDDPHVDAKS